MSLKKFIPWITVLATLATIVINILANALPFNDLNTGEISDRYPVLFVPAGYVFAIWGVIYIGWIAYSIYQVLPANRDSETLQKIAPLYWLASLANSVWLVFWHFEQFALTLPVMLVLLACLIRIYLLIRPAKATFSSAAVWSVSIPFSVYLGWITVATVANASQLLYWINWSGWGISPVAWTVIMIAVTGSLGVAMLIRERDAAYALVLVWALLGIAAKQSAIQSIALPAYITAGILAIGILLVFARKSR
ncbi:MAG: tryptophan-rich sensory protein [Anaerolineae bacterium]|nr:MAG: tryptophan-rich sensory protein [Anaerolineae bacterium]